MTPTATAGWRPEGPRRSPRLQEQEAAREPGQLLPRILRDPGVNGAARTTVLPPSSSASTSPRQGPAQPQRGRVVHHPDRAQHPPTAAGVKRATRSRLRNGGEAH